MAQPLIIAIDGPSGAGKSTLGRMLAREFDLLYLDTGSMYRAVALAVMESSISASDDVAVGSLASRVQVDLKGGPDDLEVWLDGRNVTEAVRSEEVTHLSSVISVIPQVRRAMVERQREMGRRGAVLNGRDIGTVVFPEADFKFFLTASPTERAQRRYQEQKEQRQAVAYKRTFEEMCERDRRDATRADSPLTIADDAVVIDSTGLTVEEVFDRMVALIKNRQGKAV